MATSSHLFDLLKPERLTSIVDIGANPIDGDPPYKPMLAAGLCQVTGLEPQEDALRQLRAGCGSNERYLPYSIGDGGEHTLNYCRAPGMTSLFEPDPVTLGSFGELAPLAEVHRRLKVKTRRLDDVEEIAVLDFLKVDVQGSELSIFQNGENKLRRAVAIQTEVSFIPLYRNQPVFGAVDTELRRQGFIPHCFAALKRWPIAPCVIDNDPRRPLNQLLEADVVYMRDFMRPEGLSDEQLKQLALIAHHCYRSFDLALRCLLLLEQRHVLAVASQQSYLASVRRSLKPSSA